MRYQIVYLDEVHIDIRDAKEWYKLQLAGLNKKFAEDIKAAIIRLKENPFAHTVRYKNIRIAHPDIFPYSIHFYIDEGLNTIVITAVVHTKRDPELSKRRS
jgi:mRNA-degrading endonuclease RelE of RelBE toxin-antitoxin system